MSVRPYFLMQMFKKHSTYFQELLYWGRRYTKHIPTFINIGILDDITTQESIWQTPHWCKCHCTTNLLVLAPFANVEDQKKAKAQNLSLCIHIVLCNSFPSPSIRVPSKLLCSFLTSSSVLNNPPSSSSLLNYPNNIQQKSFILSNFLHY